MDQVTEIKLEDLKVSELNPRKFIDKDKIDELAESIKEVGIINPITVRKVGLHYEIVCGERRFQASKVALKDTIPAIIKVIDDKNVIEIQIIENLQREDMDPIDEAEGFKAAIEKFGYTQADLASKVGKSLSTIKDRLRLLGLSAEIKNAISKCIIVAGHGVVLSRINDKEERAELFNEIKYEKMSVRVAENSLNYLGADFENVAFDKRECKTCEYNGNMQGKLFDSDTHLKGKCLNTLCFIKKVNEATKSQIKTLKKEGTTVVTSAEYKVRGEAFQGNWRGDMKKECSKGYVDKCLSCDRRVYVICIRGHHNKEYSKLEEYCLSPGCFVSMINGEKFTEKGSSGEKKGGNSVDPNQYLKVAEAKGRFWIKKSAENIDKRMKSIMILWYLLKDVGCLYTSKGSDKCIFPEGKAKAGLNEWDSYSYAGLDELTDQEIKIVTDKAIEVVINSGKVFTENIKFMCNHLGFTVKDDWKIDRDYLKAKQQKGIIAIAEEIGLVKYLEEKKVKGFQSMKKSEMIDLFFDDKGNPLVDKVPKEMLKK